MKQNLKLNLKRIIALILTVAMFFTLDDMDNLKYVFAATEMTTHDRLDGYNVDVTVPISASSYATDFLRDSLNESSNNFEISAYVYVGDENVAEDDTTRIENFSGLPASIAAGKCYKIPVTITLNSGCTSGTVTGLPIYYKEGTGNQADGGTGTYATDSNFYRLVISSPLDGTVDGVTMTGMYVLSYNSGNYRKDATTSYIHIKVDDNDLIWNNVTTATIQIKEQDMKTYSTSLQFYSESEVKNLPDSLKNNMYLQYTDSTEEVAKENKTKMKSVTYKENSLFTYEFYGIPTMASGLKLYVPEISGYTVKVSDYDSSEDISENGNKTGTLYTLDLSKYDFPSITLIKQTEVTGTITWYDEDLKDSRPSIDKVKALLSLYQVDGTTNAVTEIDTSKYTVSLTLDNSQTEDTVWDLSVTGLPLYDENGVAYNYYYKFAKDGDTTLSKYSLYYYNGSKSTNTSLAYSGAQLYISPKQDTTDASDQFSVTVKWYDDSYNNVSDDSSTNQARKAEISSGVNLYLWRYAGAGNAAKATQVYDDKGNQYSYKLKASDADATDGTFTLGLSNFSDDTFATYSDKGQKYYYYVTAVDSGSGYLVSYYLTDDETNSANSYAESDQIIRLTRNGLDNIEAKVNWKAAGETDYIGTTTTLQLQRKVKGSSDNWTNVEETANVVTPQASASAKTVKATFTNVTAYTSEGKTYEFRVIETNFKDSLKEDSAVSCTWEDNTDTTTYHGHTYKLTAGTSENDYMVTNLLYGNHNFTMRFTWSYSGASSTFTQKRNQGYNSVTTLEDYINLYTTDLRNLADGSTDGKTFSMYMSRNGVYYPVTLEKTDSSTQYTYQLTMAGTKYSGTMSYVQSGQTYVWTISDLNLPTYDADGNKYKYRMVESYSPSSGTTVGKKNQELLDHYSDYILMQDTDYDSYTYSTFSVYFAVYAQVIRYRIYKSWDDNQTDIRKRSTAYHMLVMKKEENTGNYTFLYDLGKLSSDSSDSNNYFTTGTDDKLTAVGNSTYTASITGENAKWVNFKPLNLLSNLNIPEGNILYQYKDNLEELYYVMAEYSITYNGATQTTPFADLQVGDTVVTATGKFDSSLTTTKLKLKMDKGEEIPSIAVYSYQISCTPVLLQGAQVANGASFDKNISYVNKIKQLYTHVTTEITWTDSTDSSGYRKDALKVELYQSNGFTDQCVETKYIEKNSTGSGITVSADKNTYDIDFGQYPMFDTTGNPYSYSFKQYIVTYGEDETDKDSYTCSEVKATDTALSTKNHYLTVTGGENEAYLQKDGNGENQLCYKTPLYAHNRATNKFYSTDFYIVWHDMSAYEGGARPDMKYILKYKIDGEDDSKIREVDDSVGYTAVLLTADKEADNPYYQDLLINGLNEFDDEGNKIHYYVTAVNTSTSKKYTYEATYYAIDNSQLVKGQQIDLTDASKNAAKHRLIPSGTTASSKSYIGEKQVILFGNNDYVTITGTKKWANLSAKSKKPTCYIYLYRDSDYDTNYKKPGSGDKSYSDLTTEEKAANYFRKTSLNANKDGYGFYQSGSTTTLEQFPKFDTYGKLYTYEIGEDILGDDGKQISVKIMAGESDTNQLLVNTYDPENKNQRSITITKQWEIAEKYLSGINANPPIARFYVYQVEAQYLTEGDSFVFPKADQLDYSQVLAYLNNQAGSASGTSNKLATYLSNQSKVSGTSNVALVKTVYMQYDVNVAKGQKSTELTGLPIYAPDGRAYVYFVVEDTSYVPSYTVTNGAADNALTEQTLTNGSTSTCLSQAPMDYIYMVSNRNVSVTDSTLTNTSSAGFINTYTPQSFTSIKGSITWNEGKYTIGKDVRPDISHASDYITINVTRYASTQLNYTSANKQAEASMAYGSSEDQLVINWTQDENNANIWNYTITCNGTDGFLKYAENGNAYIYKVTEVFATTDKATEDKVCVLGSNYAISGNARTAYATNATADNSNVLSMATIYNTIKGSLTVNKTWDDGHDSYGLRPTSVLMMIQYEEPASISNGVTTYKAWKTLVITQDTTSDSNNVTVLPINKASGWKSTISNFPVANAYGTYRYRAVEIAFGYTKDSTTKWSATTSVATSADLATYQSSTNKELKLFDNKLNWDYTIVTDLTNPDSASYTKTDKTEDNKTYSGFRSCGTFGSYRIYPQSAESGKDGDQGVKANASGNVSLTIKNTLDQSTSFIITKNWEDDSDAFGLRPTSVKLMLQKREIASTKEETDTNYAVTAWSDVKVITMTNKNVNSSNTNQWILELENLPVYSEDETFYEYRVVEIGNLNNAEVTISKENGGLLTNYYNESYYTAGSEDNDSIISDLTQIQIKTTYQLSASASISALPHNGNYYMSSYEYSDWNKTCTVTITNTLETEKKATVNKDWNVLTDSKSGDEAANELGYQSKVEAKATYSDGSTLSQIVTLDGSESGSDRYQYTWNIPSYNGSASLTDYVVREVSAKVVDDSDEATDDFVAVTSDATTKTNAGAQSETFTDQNEGKWQVVTACDDTTTAGTKAYTITNTPLTTHKLEVTFDKDNSNAFATRSTSANLKLQYRIKGATAWTALDTSCDFYKNMLSTVKASATKTLTSTELSAGSYSYTFSGMPMYGVVDNAIKAFEYRIIETSNGFAGSKSIAISYTDETALSGSLAVKAITSDGLYGASAGTSGSDYTSDTVVGGYSFTYADHDTDATNIDATITKLTKTLYTTTLKGTKTWSDLDSDTTNDKYGTRPVFDATTNSNDSTNKGAVIIGVYSDAAATKTIPVTPEIAWTDSDTTDQVWEYQVTTKLPKYAAGTNTLATYYVKETAGDKQYTASYVSSAASASRDTIQSVAAGSAENSAVVMTLGTITNTLNTVTMTAQKKWANQASCQSLNFEQVSVTYTLQAKAGTATQYSNVKDKAGNLITVTLTYAGATNNVSTASISGLPKVDNSGYAYNYRFLETELKVNYLDAANGNAQIPVTYTLSGAIFNNDASKPATTYKVMQSVNGATATNYDSLTVSVVEADSFAYEFGPMKATYGESTDGLTGTFTNTALVDTISMSQTWSEKKVDGTTNDATLKANFRPSSVAYSLQQKATTEADTAWANFNLTGTSSAAINLSVTADAYSKTATDLTTTSLPVYGYENGEIVTYQYRIYEDSADTTQIFTYSNATTSNLSNSYYAQTQATTKSGHAFTTAISNTLKTISLEQGINFELDGTVNWQDAANALSKRPATLNVVLTASYGGTTTTKTENLTLGKADGAATSGRDTYTADTTIGGASKTITITCTKEANKWIYQISGLPLYSDAGDYISYAISQGSAATDYAGYAAVGGTNEKSYATVADFTSKKNLVISSYKNAVYAAGTVTNTINTYTTEGKKADSLDLVEDITTELTVEKTWVDNKDPYGVRPDELTVKIQRELVTLNEDGTVADVKEEWTDYTGSYQRDISTEATATAKATVTEGTYTITETDGTSETYGTGVWTYTYKNLPQIEIIDNVTYVCRYRALEASYGPSGIKDKNAFYLTQPVPELIGEGKTYADLSEAPHISSYYLYAMSDSYDNSAKAAGSSFGHCKTSLVNRLDIGEDITVVKKWACSDTETTKADQITMTLIGVAQSATVNNEPTIYRTVLNASNDWTATWTQVPKYDLNFNRITWTVEETKVGSGSNEVSVTKTDATSENADIGGYYTYKGQDWVVNYSSEETGADQLTFTIINAPSQTVSMTVNYADDLDNTYTTRPDTATAVLQACLGSDATWHNWKKPNEYSASATITATGDSYTYSFLRLPTYVYYDNAITPVTYRIIETEQNYGDNTLAVSYVQLDAALSGDTALSQLTLKLVDGAACKNHTSGGYTYTYSDDTAYSASLTKKLLTMTLSGCKLWDDYSNQYNTRPEPKTGDANTLTLTLKDSNLTGSLVQPTYTWTKNAGDTNRWDYVSGQVPLYTRGTNTLANYTLTESYANDQYLVSYAPENADSIAVSTKSQSQDSNGSYTMYAMTNTLQGGSIEVNKIWVKDDETEKYDITFTLYQKIGSSTEFTRFTYDGAPSNAADVVLEAGESKVSWEGLPLKTITGDSISYEVRETTVDDHFITDVSCDTTTYSDKIVYTFTNIETMDYTIVKQWEYVNPTILPEGQTSFTAEGIIEQQVAGQTSWTSAKVKENNSNTDTSVDRSWSITSSKEDAATEKSATASVTKLPKYTLDGKAISYRAVETKVNGQSLTSYDDYRITNSDTSNATADGDETKTTITNAFKEVNVTVHTTDKTNGLDLLGTEITLYKKNADGDYVAVTTITVDENGEGNFPIHTPGEYKIVQSKAPTGYETNLEQTFTLTEEDFGIGKTLNYNAPDPRKTGTITIYKTDGDSDVDLTGVKFDVYKRNTGNIFKQIWNFFTGKTYTYLNEIAISTTSDGTTTISGLEWGSYYIVETATLDGYLLESNNYYFTVNAQTAEACSNGTNLQLYCDYDAASQSGKAGTELSGNIIKNVKNSFKIQNREINAAGGTPIIIGASDAVFEIHDKRTGQAVSFYLAASSREAVTQISKATLTKAQTDASVARETFDLSAESITIYGLPAGDYQLVQVTGPSAYAKAESVAFSLKADGQAMKSILSAWADNTVIIENMPEEKLQVTKKFEGDASWKNAIRQTVVTLQLYRSYTDASGKVKEEACGKQVEIAVNTSRDTYQYDFSNLPMYLVTNNGTYALSYSAKEVWDTDYVKYYRDKATNAVTYFYYENDSSVELDASSTAGKAGALYKETIKNTLNEDALKNTYLSINNVTENKKVAVDENGEVEVDENGQVVEETTHDTDAGGTIGLIEGSVANDERIVSESYSQIDYSESMYGVFWKAEEDWMAEDTYTVSFYTLDDPDVLQKITVEDFLNEDGSIKDSSDACFDELKAAYGNFEIKKTENDTYILYLGHNSDQVNFLNKVDVEFQPTIAVINTTDEQKGGMVKVDSGTYQSNSDGKGQNNDSRYVGKNTVYAQAEEGYYIDLSSLEIGTVGSIDVDEETNQIAGIRIAAFKGLMLAQMTGSVFRRGESVKALGDDGSQVEALLSYSMAGQTNSYKLSGNVEVTQMDDQGFVTGIALHLDDLTIPVDIGISFAPVPTSSDSVSQQENTSNNQANTVNTDSTDKKAKASTTNTPKTGDDTNKAPYVILFLAGLSTLWIRRKRMKKY